MSFRWKCSFFIAFRLIIGVLCASSLHVQVRRSIYILWTVISASLSLFDKCTDTRISAASVWLVPFIIALQHRQQWQGQRSIKCDKQWHNGILLHSQNVCRKFGVLALYSARNLSTVFIIHNVRYFDNATDSITMAKSLSSSSLLARCINKPMERIFAVVFPFRAVTNGGNRCSYCCCFCCHYFGWCLRCCYCCCCRRCCRRY